MEGKETRRSEKDFDRNLTRLDGQIRLDGRRGCAGEWFALGMFFPSECWEAAAQ